MTLLKKTLCDKLSAKVNNIDINRFVLETKYGKNKWELEKKISDTSGIVKNFYYNAKITKIESKILNIGCLATNSELTAVKK